MAGALVMSADWQRELERAIRSDLPLEEIVALLRRYKKEGVSQREVYSVLENMRAQAPDEATDDRILEVSDFVAGFCSTHMKVWDN
jgi:hypothetical protein